MHSGSLMHGVSPTSFLQTTVLASLVSMVRFLDSRAHIFIGNLSSGHNAHEQVWGISNSDVMCILHGMQYGNAPSIAAHLHNMYASLLACEVSRCD
jgi:hypothetical protein